MNGVPLPMSLEDLERLLGNFLREECHKAGFRRAVVGISGGLDSATVLLLAARALGRPGLSFEWDAVRAVVTRYDAGQQAEFAALMQAYLGTVLSPYRQDFTALVGQAGEQVNGIYEADYREFNRDTYVRGRETFDRTWAEVKEIILGTWWRDLEDLKAEQMNTEANDG